MKSRAVSVVTNEIRSVSNPFSGLVGQKTFVDHKDEKVSAVRKMPQQGYRTLEG
jgi:hypothetical protein